MRLKRRQADSTATTSASTRRVAATVTAREADLDRTTTNRGSYLRALCRPGTPSPGSKVPRPQLKKYQWRPGTKLQRTKQCWHDREAWTPNLRATMQEKQKALGRRADSHKLLGALLPEFSGLQLLLGLRGASSRHPKTRIAKPRSGFGSSSSTSSRSSATSCTPGAVGGPFF